MALTRAKCDLNRLRLILYSDRHVHHLTGSMFGAFSTKVTAPDRLCTVVTIEAVIADAAL